MSCPCQDCPDRRPGEGCHDSCDKYTAWKKERKKVRDWLISQEAPHRETIRKRETEKLRRLARGWDRKR